MEPDSGRPGPDTVLGSGGGIEIRTELPLIARSVSLSANLANRRKTTYLGFAIT